MAHVLVSAVTDEFEPYRERLRQLETPYLGVHIQEQFGPSGGILLEKLEGYVRASAYVIHLVGSMTGATPPPSEVREFIERRPDLVRRLPALEGVTEGRLALSYTQWEAYLASYHGQPLLCCASSELVRDEPEPGGGNRPAAMLEQAARQREHLRRLKALNHHVQLTFDGPEQLLVGLLRAPDLMRIRQPPLPGEFAEQVLKPRGPAQRAESEPAPDRLHKRRRDVLGKKPLWSFLQSGSYCERPELLATIMRQFDVWRVSLADAELSMPVFWLDGRSGDGKSVLMLQLVEHFLQREPRAVCVKLDSAADVPRAMRALAPHRGRAYAVVDDLHREALAGRKFFDDVSAAIERGCPPLPIITCGPTPEMEAFRREGSDSFVVQSAAVRGPSEAELARFAAWLGARLPPAQASSDLLVEFLFELQVDMPLISFARSFRDRLRSADPAVFERVQVVAAMNGLGLLADAALLGETRGRDFLERLSKPDQGHFDIGRKFPGGQSGIWFSHSRIAWRLFDEWSHDALLDRPLSRRLARALLESLLLYRERLEDIQAVIGSLLLRLPELVGEQGERTTAEVVEELIQRLGDTPELEASVLQFTLQLWLLHRLDAPGDVTLRRAEAACRNVSLEPWVRLRIAAALVVNLRRSAAPRFADVNAFTRELLFAPEHRGIAASTLVMLAARPEAAAARWSVWPREWLLEDPGHVAVTPVLQWLLPRSRDDGSLIELASSWLEANGSAPYSHHLVPSLLAAAGTRPDVVQLALDWWGAHEVPERSHHVLAALLKASKSADLVRRVLDWWDSHQTIGGSHQIFEAILTNGDMSEPLVSEVKQRALDWWQNNQAKQGSHQVVTSLLSRADMRQDAFEPAFEWCRLQPLAAGAPQVLESLLALAGDRRDVVEYALVWWEQHHTLAAGSHQVLASTLTAIARLVKPPVELCERAIEHARACCQADEPASAGTAQVVDSLLVLAGSRSEVLDGALAWCKAQRTLGGAHQVLSSLITFGGPRDDVVRYALDWIKASPESPGARRVLTSLLALPKRHDDVVDWALKCLGDESLEAEAGEVLRSLLRQAGDREDVVKEALAWWDAPGGGKGDDFLVLLLRTATGASRQQVLVRAIARLKARGAACPPRFVSVLLITSAEHDPTILAVLAWLDDNPPPETCGAVLTSLLVVAGSRADVVERAHRWLEQHPEAKSRHAVESRLLQLQAQRDPSSPELSRSMRRFIAGKGHLALRVAALECWLSCSGSEGAAFDFIIETHHTASEARVQAVLAVVSARHAGLMFAAIASKRSMARAVFRLVAEGARRRGGAALLGMRESWPVGHEASFWLEMLGTGDVPVQVYSAEFARWLRSVRTLPGSLRTLLARRRDLDPVLQLHGVSPALRAQIAKERSAAGHRFGGAPRSRRH